MGFQCGHTMVFFRAGALAALEEARDNIVLKLVRWMQGECYGRVRRRVYNKKADQRELMKVIQRNFRKFMTLRTWGWFIIIQKTKPLIGQLNPEQELANLEEKVKEVFGAYQEALDVTKQLEGDNVRVKEEITALTKQLEAEQGNLTVYQERQSKAAGQKVKCEQELAKANKVLADEIDDRISKAEDTKKMNGEVAVIKKDIEDLELALQRLEQEKTNRDHTIRGLNDEIAQNDEAINKLNKEKKHIADNQAKSSDDLQAASDKVTHLNGVKTKLEQQQQQQQQQQHQQQQQQQQQQHQQQQQ